MNSSYHLPPARDAKLTDVPSHSRVLPTVLKNAGVDFLHLGCNPGSASPQVPTLFWWQGPDGSRLLTFYRAEYYGSGILPPEELVRVQKGILHKYYRQVEEEILERGEDEVRF